MKLNTYRLSSLEDPTDEQLHALMEQVAVAARESSRKAKRELKESIPKLETKEQRVFMVARVCRKMTSVSRQTDALMN